ncbi:MAG: chromosome segregation protein SMC [Rhodobacteraceae bacterium]|nr:chromosome segregation protein SMC [Paracoccaceae bacterium]
MRFSNLRLTGFKSFFDPTEISIKDGLTGIVGPNGCGKSNLLEALRWVMGENRPSTMRGDGMEDVIFNGSATRPAKAFAEVVLRLDNREHRPPAEANDADTLEISRRISRNMGSTYTLNGRETRARDIQRLFADASTGAHSHALVQQGQITELVRSKPQARRRILEEAAGIAGLYQRRHEAELKLQAAQANLARLDDVITQIAAQLTTLKRQARQAERYRQIGETLRESEAMLLCVRWREADAAHAATEADLAAQTRAVAQAEAEALRAADLCNAKEAHLPTLREAQNLASAGVQRLRTQSALLQQERTQAEQSVAMLQAQVAQLLRDREREGALNRDAGENTARLHRESRALAAQQEGHDARLQSLFDAVQQAERGVQKHEARLATLTSESAQLSARAQSAQRQLGQARAARQDNSAKTHTARQMVDEAQRAMVKHAHACLVAKHAEAEAAQRVQTTEQTMVDSAQQHSAAQKDEAQARTHRAEAEGKANALRAQIAALAKGIDQKEDQRQGQGPQSLDQLQVEKGYEAALGAALADDLQAPLASAPGMSGWHSLPPFKVPPALPQGATPLAHHVIAPQALQRRLSQIGLITPEAAPALHAQLLPGQRLVSLAGDLWRWDGYHLRAGDVSGAARMRLQQRNRLAELTTQLDTAQAQAQDAIRNHKIQWQRLEALGKADGTARAQHRAAEAALSAAGRAHSEAESTRILLAGKIESLAQLAQQHEQATTEAAEQEKNAAQALAGLAQAQMADRVLERARAAMQEARTTLTNTQAAHNALRHEGETRARRSTQLAEDIAGWQQRLQTAGQRMGELTQRHHDAEAALRSQTETLAEIETRGDSFASRLTRGERDLTQATEALTKAETDLREVQQLARRCEDAASTAREARAAAQARSEAAHEGLMREAARIKAKTESIGATLLERMSTEGAALPSAAELEARIVRLQQQRHALGAVNLRATQDAQQRQQEHDTLLAQQSDLHAAITTLRHAIADLNREGRKRLLDAHKQVHANFAMLFRHLFGGGAARLALVESEDPLEAGLEIMCQPPGKSLSTLSLLSGGEQTLTALALIFAVFLVAPAPICVLDEADAALDDANVGRFCDLLDEMSRRTETRFLIITHHALTMARLDRLFGLTMVEAGVSQIVSVDLAQAESLVA